VQQRLALRWASLTGRWTVFGTDQMVVVFGGHVAALANLPPLKTWIYPCWVYLRYLAEMLERFLAAAMILVEY
jgi:hypothetical protein